MLSPLSKKLLYYALLLDNSKLVTYKRSIKIIKDFVFIISLLYI
jgi:hypothetical protein